MGEAPRVSFSHDVRPSLNCRTHERTFFHVHNAIIACLTQLLMNSDSFHATQMEESNVNVAIEVSKTSLSLDDVTAFNG